MRLGNKLWETIRPREARWFELYVPRNETIYAIESLAATGEVQLELSTYLASPLDVDEIRRALHELDDYCKTHHIALPRYEMAPSQLLSSPEKTADQALFYVRHWGERLFTLQEEMRKLQMEWEELRLLEKCLKALPGDDTGIELFAHHSDFLCKGIYACPHDQPLSPRLKSAVTHSFVRDGTEFFFLAALPDQQTFVDYLVEHSECIEVKVPDWLPAGRSTQEPVVKKRLDIVEQSIQHLQHNVEMHRASPKLKKALANAAVLRWFLGKASEVAGRGHFCHVTGWSTLPEPGAIESLLKKAGIHAVVRHPLPPCCTSLPPVRILETWWSRPFHLFQAFSGIPERGEIDPGIVIPVVVPLLFGFMFPDVGHGLMILLFGFILGVRQPQIRFLIPCGFSSMIFGLLFGEAFGIEGLLPVLWFRPLDEPLRVLGISLVIGCGLILTGMLFSAIEAKWRGLLREWFATDAPLLGLYLAASVGIFYDGALLALPILLLWYLIGSTLLQLKRGKIDIFATIGRLLQSTAELLLNSFSFIRIGAFALAHAGLTATVIVLADSMESNLGHAIVLIIGHLLVVGLEGLIVFIQTTRLILFEFFIRFLRAEGRLIRPLSFPDQ